MDEKAKAQLLRYLTLKAEREAGFGGLVRIVLGSGWKVVPVSICTWPNRVTKGASFLLSPARNTTNLVKYCLK